MSYGEQVIWAERVLENPEAARIALDGIKRFQDEFAELVAHHTPLNEEAQRFYEDMLANVLTDYAFSIRRD